MKNTYTLILIVIPSICFSQNFSQKKIHRLNLLEVDLDKVDFNNQKDYVNLSVILEKDKRWKLNKIIGIVSASVSAIILVGITTNIAEVLNGGGSIYLESYLPWVIATGISVPLLISSKKRKKERDLLIKRINN